MRRYMSRIALLLSILMLQFLVPYDVMALDSDVQEENAEQVEQTVTELTGHEDEVEIDPEVSALLGSLNDEEPGEDPELLFEWSDKRNETDSKHFMNSDGTFTAVKYPYAVHFQTEEDGEYIDIDNRLTERTAVTEEEILLASMLMGDKQMDTLPFFPSASPIKTALAPDTSARFMAAVENDGHIISWNYEEIHEGLYQEITGEVSEQEENLIDPSDEPVLTDQEEETSDEEPNDALEEDTPDEVVLDDHEQEEYSNDEITEEPIDDPEDLIDEGKPVATAEPMLLIPEDEELSAERDAVRCVASGLAYRDAAEGMSLEYILSSDVMEESIVLENVDTAHSYHLVLDIGDLSIEQLSSNELLLLDGEGRVIFTVSAPFMKDSSEQYSSDVSFDILSEKDGKVLIEIIPDMEWLLDPSRTYPVRIDPFIFQFTKSFDEDAAALYTHPSYPYGTLVIGNDNGASYGKAKSYVKFTLPTLNKGDMVIGGLLEIRQYAGTYGYSHVNTPTLRVNAYKVTSSWTASQVIASTGYSNLPTNDDKVLDYKDISNPGAYAASYDFDVSRAVKEWYEGETNYGIMLRAEDETARALACFIASDNLSYPQYRPLLFIQYLNNRGLESYWTYHEVPIGDSGTLYVNDYTGNPVIIFPLASTPGSYAPASLSLVYNGYISGEPADEYTKPGLGFRLNVQERITAITSTGSELMQKLYIMGYRYIYTDSDGTQHYFEEDSGNTGTYIDEEGLKLKLIVQTGNTEYYKLSSDDGSYKTFVQSGLLYKIYGKDGVGVITLSYNGGTISGITDGANRYITVTADSNGKVTSVTDPAGRTTSISYYGTGNYISTITYPDNTTVTVNYSGVRLKDIKARNGQRIRLIYASGTDPHVTNRVAQVTEYNNSGTMNSANSGQYLQMDYSQLNETKFTDRNNRSEYYQFDNSGRTVSVRDCSGGASIYKYYADRAGKKSNALMFTASGEKFAANLLTNHSFEDGLTGFTYTGTAGTDTNTDDLYLGSKVGTLTGQGSISQTVSASAGSWYTFSAYFKTTGVTNAKLRLEFLNALNTVLGTSETIETDHTVSNYDRFLISAKAPTGTKKVRASLVSSTGTVFTDCWQLEKGETLNHYNMLSNSDFTGGISGWTRYRFEDIDGIVTFNTDKAIRMYGSTTREKKLIQSVYIGKKANAKNFLMSAMVKMDSVPLTAGRHAGIGMTAYYEDGTSETKWADAEPGVSTWQKVSTVFHFDTARKITYVDAFLTYSGNANICYFDKVSLTSDQTGTAFVVDDDGNVTTAADNAGMNTTYTYNNMGELANAETQDNQNYDFTYYTTSDPTTSHPHFLKTATSERSGIEFGFTYDSNWNLTESRVTGNDGKYIKESAEYSFDKAFVTKRTDAAGKETEYDYGSDNYGLLRNVTDPEGNTTYYGYDEDNGRLETMSQTENGCDISYTYGSHGELTGIATDSTDYTFTYDSFGRAISTAAGGITLSTNTYADHDGNLLSTQYGNGDTKSFTYDSYGRVTGETLTSGNNYEYYHNSFCYNAFGLIGKVEDGRNGKTYDYSYDLTDRPLKVTISDGTVIQTRYNTENAVEDYDVRFRGEAASTDYHYSNIDRMPDWSTFNGSWVEKYDYDDLGRIKEKKDYFEIGDVALTTYYTYVDPDPNDTDRTTGLVDTIVCRDGAGMEIYAGYRDYDYDSNGRISEIKVKDSNGTIKHHSYVYDSKGQLIRHNDEEAGISYSYYYDSAGNIQSVRESPYSTGTLGFGLYSKIYNYTNSAWGDLLTAYGSMPIQPNITYDGMGNPTAIVDADLTWEGRELTEWYDGTDDLLFSYDPDGYRVSKTVNDVTTDYLVSGGKILAENNGTDSIHYFYDSNGNISAMKYGGVIYYYIKDAEGDILGIMEAVGGDVVATYSYDAWGVPTVTNYGNSTIGDINPFRYRGYYYDSETGLYYVSSRYYDPGIGRWISADSKVNTNNSFTGCNLFTYCLNNPINCVDVDGKDAVLLYDDSFPGHIGALIQDESGSWLHFYWGTAKGWTRVVCMFGIDVDPLSWNIPYLGEIDLEQINMDGTYAHTYEEMLYLKGDFSTSADLAKETVEKYNLYSNNCSQVTLRILAASNTIYSDALALGSTIIRPRKAFKKVKQSIAAMGKYNMVGHSYHKWSYAMTM